MPSLLCKLLGHRRSRRDARRIDARWISYCRRCGSLMVREAPRRWSAVIFVDGVPVERIDEGAG
ncbi:MAG TPA: hypothetical protein VFK50_07070 [Sphingomicrobium sp.]|nr:hypothetical protein [Sphingomicrobium sp.]